MKLNSKLVKRSLSAHSAVGLVVGVLMYLICLTGALAALAETFERWEQPEIPEFRELVPSVIDTAMREFRAELNSSPESLWVVFPSAAIPRMHVTDGEQERFLRPDGTLDAEPVKGWTHMLRELHVQLHLPQTIGLVLVSSVGVMLLSLIISGLFAHPRLFKDAFKLRAGGARRLEQADLHNRLSVWALPFHLMIGLTGAFYGLVGLLAVSASLAWYDGDRQALFDTVYGSDPVVQGEATAPLNIAEAMSQLKQRHPDVTPLFLVAQKLGTPGQLMEIAATLPGRLAYSEIYRFDADGRYLGSQELTTGPVGRQVLSSLYRVHFGYFGGQWTRIIWFVLGLALAWVSVTGVNIWLAKRQGSNRLDLAWAGFVWGIPLALIVSAIASIFTSAGALPVFLGSLLLCVVVGLKLPSPHFVSLGLKGLCALFLAVLALWHWSVFSPEEFGSYLRWVNSGLLGLAFILATLTFRSYRARISAD